MNDTFLVGRKFLLTDGTIREVIKHTSFNPENVNSTILKMSPCDETPIVDYFSSCVVKEIEEISDYYD